MILSRKWVNEYVDLSDIDNKTFCSEMTLSGSKVEGYEEEGSDISNVVVGKVLSLEKHPDSDHLWVCRVDVGADEELQIVTGAQNLTAGDIVPVALVGATVINRKDHCLEKIKKGKLRGVESAGMLCSFDELGLTHNDFPYACEDGIFVLGDDCDKTLGLDIHKAIGYDDTCVEFEITSNRCDCLSVTGLAREAAATFNRPFNFPEPQVKLGHGDVNDLLKVNILEGEKCYRYTGAVVENVRVKESPRWLRERLRASGVRPISNIVDITNYVMLEYGQPMHAFDLRYLEGNTVNVRNAVNGEKITTLDGEERTLDDSMLVIADAKKPVAVAGVMGGEYSGVLPDTTVYAYNTETLLQVLDAHGTQHADSLVRLHYQDRGDELNLVTLPRLLFDSCLTRTAVHEETQTEVSVLRRTARLGTPDEEERFYLDLPIDTVTGRITANTYDWMTRLDPAEQLHQQATASFVLGQLSKWTPLFLMFLLPVQALLFKLFYRNRRFMEHLAHSTHLSSLLLVLLVAPAAILLWHFNAERYTDVVTNGVEDAIIFLTPLALLAYQLVSMHVVYREGWSKTTAKCLLTFFLFNLLALATATGLIAWLAAKAMGRV